MNRIDIISEPVYWIEDLNGKIYDAIVRYMESHKLKQKDMAKHLDISAGRMSQILNSGDINFSYSKIVSILLKLDLIPHFELESKADYIKKELHQYAYLSGLTENKVFNKTHLPMKVVFRGKIKTVVPTAISAKEALQVEDSSTQYQAKNMNPQREIA